MQKDHVGDCVVSFGWVIECSIVDVVNRGRELITCDVCIVKVSVPYFLFGKVGCSCCFVGRNHGGSVDGVIGWGCRRDGKCHAVVLQVEDRMLEEAKVSFAVIPGARNGHEVGSEFLFWDLEEFKCWFSVDAREGRMGHLGLDGVCRYSVQHGG